MSQAENPAPTPARSIAYCSWHQGLSDTTRLVRLNEEAATGPGGLLFACFPCRQKHGLTPIGDQS